MGSAPSTPNQEGSSDPWWSIENQTLELNPSEMNSNSETNAEQSQRTNANDESDRADNLAVSSNVSEAKNQSIVAESIEFSETNKNNSDNSDENCASSSEVRAKIQNQTLEEFKEELRIKRDLRKCAISELRNEMSILRHELAQEKALNKKLMTEKRDCRCFMTNRETETTENQTDSTATSLRTQLSEVQYSLQLANAEILSLTTELSATKRQTQSLKEVIVATKQMLAIRETELNQLRTKLREIESSLSEREMKLMSENLRQEYDRQLANIRHLKALYEERSRISAAEKENLNRQLETSRAEYSAECEKNKGLGEHIASLEADLMSTNEDLFGTREQLAYYKAENRNLHEEMTVINQLFSQLLGGFSGNNDIDIDRLTNMLEDNRDLIKDITSKENCKEGAAQIPKLLLDIISHKTDASCAAGDESIEASTSTADQEQPTKLTSPQEIVNNLPKVWRVLIELLNHQNLIPVQIKENNQNEYCYKSVETPAGPKMELSLSKTYIRLKDLILEKKFLQKETKKLKNLNSQLENRLGEQENRLGAVTIELNKTWNLVGRMQRQHRQLHTHEQVLRYQLQQKRRMLTELKEELEYCRRKWALAKEKNSESQSQWEVLRAEFSSRKSQDSNNSAESGYSDGPASEEEEYEDDGSVSTETKPYIKHRANKEKFLTKTNGQKATRVHSVSPKRCIKVGICRRNSDSHVTQFATEEFQVQADAVEPIIQTHCTENCAEKCVLHSVHFENDAICTHHRSNQIQIIEPTSNSTTVCKSQVQQLVESKAAKTKIKTCFELRKSGPSVSQSSCETLEEMFMRLSGQDVSRASTTKVDKCNSSEAKVHDSERDLNEYKKKSMPEMSCPQCRIESECQPKVSIEFEMNSNPEPCTSASDNDHPSIDVDEAGSLNRMLVPQASTSTAANVKTDEDCLTIEERSYAQRRDDRLKRLEAEYEAFIKKMKSTNRRADDVENRLEYLHGRFGSESALRNGTTRQLDSDASSADTIEQLSNAEVEEESVPTESPTTESEESNGTDNGPPNDFIK